MDALPIQETSGLGFASTVPGLMHACGHDIHTTTLLGVAAVLKQMAPHFAGAVKLVFQPAEEGLGGMQAMIDDGLMTDPAIDMGLGFHNYPDMPVGHFGFVRGPALAASDKFDIVVRGKSGHAAYPHTAIDPLVAAALLVAQLQTVVTREVPPTMPAVVTVGAIQGGTTYNIIPDSCLIKGTVRTLHRPARDLAQAAIERLAAGMLVGMRVHCEVTYQRGVPCLVNDDRILDQTVTAVRAQFGDDRITPFEATMGGEDFALMAERVPSFQLKIGSGQPGRADKLHNSAYQPDEACIGLGVQALSHAALQLLI
jgi:amidohydrolase